MKTFNFGWKEGAKPKYGFNFDIFPGGITIFRFAYLKELKTIYEKTEYICPDTRDICFGTPVEYSMFYFRLRKPWLVKWKTPILYNLTYGIKYRKLKMLKTHEQWRDEQQKPDCYDSRFGWA